MASVRQDTGHRAEVVTSVAGLAIRSERAGTGAPVVVLHNSFGNPGWLPFHEHLAVDHEVLVPDLPGFGCSERPEWARDPRDLALLVGLWLDAEGRGPVSVVGLGFGGWVAAELLASSPARLRHLVLVGAAGLLPRHGRITDQVLLAHGEYVQRAFADRAVYEQLYGSEPSDDVLLQWDLNRETVYRLTWKPYMYNRRLEPLLPELDVPTLVVWGERDGIVPLECGERYAALLPHARLEIVPGAGHAVAMERPDVLAGLVRQHIAETPVEEVG